MYVNCERPTLKYTQTRVCWNLYTGTRTVSDSYSCLCERSLMQVYLKNGLLKLACTCVSLQKMAVIHFILISI